MVEVWRHRQFVTGEEVDDAIFWMLEVADATPTPQGGASSDNKIQ